MTRGAIWTIRAASAAAAALGAWHYTRAERQLAGAYGFSLDDPYIHLQFARNLVEGGGFSFNAGEPSAGSTSPLWTWMLAVMLRAGGDPVLGPKVLGTLLTIAAAWLAADLARIVTRSSLAALVAGLGVALSPRLTWGSVSGMEVPLYTALSMLALVRYLAPSARWRGDWGLWAGLAGTARPETFVLFPILAVHHVWRRWRASPQPPLALLRDRELQVATTVFLVVCLAFLLHNLRAGSLLPTTFAAKSGGDGILHLYVRGEFGTAVLVAGRAAFEEPNLLARFVYDQSALMFALALPGVLGLLGVIPGLGWRAGGGVLVACCLVMPAVMGAVSPGPPLLLQEGRYVAHLLAIAFVIAGAGLAALGHVTGRPVVVGLIAVLMLARLASQDVKFAPRHAAMVDNILRQQVAVGEWIAAHTPPDTVIATNDIGAIAWVSRRRIIDTEGLVTPRIVPYKRAGRHLEFIEQVRPDLLVIFPEWYPHLARRDDLFREIHRNYVPRVSAAEDTLVIYLTPWSRFDEIVAREKAEGRRDNGS